MRKKYLYSPTLVAMVVMLAGVAHHAPAQAATVASAPGASVTIDVHVDSLGVGGTGSFEASSPLCPSGNFVIDQGALATFTCGDGTGSFNIGRSGPITSGGPHSGYFSTWHFASGTGAYAGIRGGGDVTSDTCAQGVAPCDFNLAGTVALH